jgi:hypothetical protein
LRTSTTRTDFFLRMSDLRVSASHTIGSWKSSSETLASFFFLAVSAVAAALVVVVVVKLRILLSQSWQ